VTCFFGVLDAPAGRVAYASAGQGPIVFYDRAADRFDQHAATAMPLGVIEGMDFDELVDRDLPSGDMLIVITDGFFEASDPAGEPFGMERICEMIRRDRDRPAAEIIARLWAAVEAFTAGAPQADDLTAVIVKRL